MIEQAYFGVDDEPVLQKDRYAKFTSNYYEHDNRVETICFDTKDDPTTTIDKRSFTKAIYDERKNLLSTFNFNTKKKCANRLGKFGEAEELANPFGEYKELIIQGLYTEMEIEHITNIGFCEVERSFDMRGHETRRDYYDANGEKIAGPEGFCSFSITVNSLGLPEMYELEKDDNSEPIFMKIEYTSRRLISKIWFETINGGLYKTNFGFESMQFIYNCRFENTDTKYFDENEVEVKLAS